VIVFILKKEEDAIIIRANKLFFSPPVYCAMLVPVV
jgi:hypothetical protein